MRAGHHAGQSDPARNPQFSRCWAEPDGLRHISGPADKAVKGMAIKAAKHWLAQAETVKGDRRKVCIETATAIIRMAGMGMADIQGKRAA